MRLVVGRLALHPSRFFIDGLKIMYMCYVDESGTPQVPGNTSHYILAGLSIPIWHWKDCEREILEIKNKYSLTDTELHAGWIRRRYLEQENIPDFQELSLSLRRSKVESLRKARILQLQKSGDSKKFRQVQKNYLKTAGYIHLTYKDRENFLNDVARCVSNWGFARLFAECVDKIYYDPRRSKLSVDEQAFEQVVSRYEHYLRNISNLRDKRFGLLIHDNNETVSKRHTSLMKQFHNEGTLWTSVENIIETPLFVDSQLTSMVQIADLCSYAIRRYLENDESTLFDLVFTRADRKGDITVGVRHFTRAGCNCKICQAHI